MLYFVAPDADWEGIDGREYMYYPGAVTRGEAEALCMATGSDVFGLDDITEMEYIINVFMRYVNKSSTHL